MQAKHPCFRMGRNEAEAECLVCKRGTYISVSYKGSADLKAHLSSAKHRKAVKRSSVRSTKYYYHYYYYYYYLAAMRRKVGYQVATAESKYAFHTVTDHNSFL